MTGVPVSRGSYDPTPSNPQTTFVADSFTRSTHDYRANTVPNVSGSFSARLPQRPANPPALGRSWDSATMRRQLQPLAPVMARAAAPNNFAQTMPPSLLPQPVPGPFQQSLNDFSSTASLQLAQAAQPPSQSDFSATRTLQQQLRHEYVANRYVPTSPPSYHTTLPKHGGGYLDGASTHRRLPNYNDLPSAGFSMSAKLRSRGIEEHPIPMLG